MTDRYALFLYDVYDSEGGVNDLEHIGTMQECIERAEKSGRNEESHIARMEDLAIVKTGRWVFTQHPLVGHPGTYEYLWHEKEVI